MVPVILECAKDRVLPVKLMAEQCLLRVFSIDTSLNDNMIKKYVDECGDIAVKRSLVDYKRVLMKVVKQPQDKIMMKAD